MLKKSRNKIATFCMAIALGIALGFSFSAEAATLKQRNTIEDDFLRLGHVFDGLSDHQDYVLAPAPTAGQSTVLNAYALNRIAAAFGLPWKASTIYEQAIIERAATIIEGTVIQNALKSHLANNNALGEFQIELSNRNHRIALPSHYDDYVDVERVDLDTRRDRFSGVIRTADNKMHEVSGRVIRITKIPVLRKTLRNGDIITNNDIEWIDVDQTQVASNLVVDAGQLIGHTPRRVITEKTFVRTNDLQMPLSVQRGDIVNVHFKTNTIQLALKGRAVSSGAVGDTVRIVNPSSNRVIDAVVTGMQTVEVKSAMNAGL